MAAESLPIRVRRAEGFFCRLRGLIGQPPLEPGQGLLFERCRQVHTCFLATTIDVVHLDEDGVVLAMTTLTPWRFGRLVAGAASVLELRAGECRRLGLAVGSRPFLVG